VPLTLDYLGPERYGMWMTISSIILMLGFADLGLGNGVLNAIAHASGSDNILEIRTVIANGLALLTLISLILILIFLAIYPFFSWASLFNVTSEVAVSEAGPVTLGLLVCFAIAVPINLTQQIQRGLQVGFWANLWDGIGHFLSLLGVLLAIWLDSGLLWLVLAVAGLPVLAQLINASFYFGFQQRWALPDRRLLDVLVMQRLAYSGLLFFVLQLTGIIGYQTDNIVIARILGAEAVAEFAVAMRVYSLPAVLVGFLAMALWPAYGEAFNRGDIAWIKSTFSKSVCLSFAIALPIILVFMIWGMQIIEWWAGPEVKPSFELVVGMGLWSMLAVLASAVSALLNGLHVVKFQIVAASVFAVTNIALSVYLVDKIGVSGAIYGTFFSHLFTFTLPSLVYIAYLYRNWQEY